LANKQHRGQGRAGRRKRALSGKGIKKGTLGRGGGVNRNLRPSGKEKGGNARDNGKVDRQEFRGKTH